MSYARFGWNGSDVYVFLSRVGLECCGCILQRREVVEAPGSFFGFVLAPVGPIVQTVFGTNEEMIEHLEEHVRAGHTVPEETFVALRDPADAEENQKILEQVRRGEN